MRQTLAVRCRGRWPELMARLAPNEYLLQAIERGPHRQGWCPVHVGTHGDAFRVFKDFADTGGAVCNSCGKFGTGFKVLMWINGWDEKTTAQALRRELDGYKPSNVTAIKPALPPPKPSHVTIDGSPTDSLLRLVAEAQPITSPAAAPLHRYLERRGLGDIDLARLRALHFHERLAYYDERRVLLGYFPALLAEVTLPDGSLVSLHRTYLTDDGEKAPVPRPKKMLNARGLTASGGAVQLMPVGSILCTSEGLENGLTGWLRNPDLPVWPALNEAMLGAMRLPPHVRHLVIWGDTDPPAIQPNGEIRRPGWDAARKLAAREREQGRTVELRFPRGRKTDWNQVLLTEGMDAIPQLSTSLRRFPSAFRLAQLVRNTIAGEDYSRMI